MRFSPRLCETVRFSDAHLAFTFLTSADKFSRVNPFSGLNGLPVFPETRRDENHDLAGQMAAREAALVSGLAARQQVEQVKSLIAG